MTGAPVPDQALAVPVEPASGLAPSGFDPSRGFDWWRLLPKYWIQNEPTDRLWDAILNRAIDEFGVVRLNGFTCQVGPFEVWVENWPYSYGRLYPILRRATIPMVRTRRRLRTLLSPTPAYPSQASVALTILASGTPTRSAETTGSVGEADGGPVAKPDAQTEGPA